MNDLTIAVYIGNMLKAENTEFISALDVQKFITEDVPNGGYNIPLSTIRNVLDTLCNACFLDSLGDVYSLLNKTIVHQTVIKNIVPFAEREEGFLNLQSE